MWNIITGIVGGAIGKTISKIIERIPTKAESRRNKLAKLRREYAKIVNEPETPANSKRLLAIMRDVGLLESQSTNED